MWRTRSGYAVETHSRYQGTTTGERVHIPADLLARYKLDSADLSAPDEDGRTDGERILDWLRGAQRLAAPAITDRIRVLRRGSVVQ